MSDAKDATFSLKVMINKEKTKVLFVEADRDFVDVLLSFLTMPLGKIVKVLEKHYGDEAPVIGSLNTLCNGLANLDSVHFWTEGGKQMLLNPRSSFDAECIRLKLDVTDTQPAEYFVCGCGYCCRRFSIISMYYDTARCGRYGVILDKEIGKKESQVVGGDGGVFTKNMGSFLISDDLHILPDETELIQIISFLGIKDTDGAKLMNVTFGFGEIMDLLKASLFSATPMSDLILDQKRQMSPAILKSEPGSTLSYQIEMDATSNSKKMILKVMLQKSTNKLLYAQAGEDFVDFLCSFLTIPLGGIVSLLGSNNSLKSINNLYKSIADLIDNKFLKTPDMKNRLIKLKLPHGGISKDQILPLTEECCSAFDQNFASLSSVKFPNGQGNYLKGPKKYKIADDLTVTPFCISSIISMLNELKIPILDIKELELQIGLQEALRILKASLTSTCVLTDALMIIPILKKEPKKESWV